MRVLAIDYGAKRIGLALCDELEMTTRPAGTIRLNRQSSITERIVEVAALENVEHVVVGLPLNMDGTEGPAATTVRRFAARLSEVISVPISLQDERLTSVAAEDWMAAEGVPREKRRSRSDEYAARTILEDFLSSRQEKA